METKADDDRFSQGDEKAASLKGRCHVADCTGILPLKHRPVITKRSAFSGLQIQQMDLPRVCKAGRAGEWIAEGAGGKPMVRPCAPA